MRTRKRFGQHFLEAVWADKVVAAIAPQRSDRFIEIGPGPGALTLRLAPRVAHLTGIEVDRDIAAELQPQLPGNVDLVVADILDVDLSPMLAGGPVRVAGNLPYNITSPILFRLIALARAAQSGVSSSASAILDATVMVQREVADRLVAGPGSGDYGVLSISVQRHADVRRVLALPPGAFRPAPKVHSSVVRLTFRQSSVVIEDEPTFETMVRSMFTQRRKTLANALAPFAGQHGRQAADALRAADIDAGRRPETLSLAELARLAACFRRRGTA
jgi:16S rRNA (adenine1518-N6/adenine1519-N6)-dimethyltransferase